MMKLRNYTKKKSGKESWLYEVDRCCPFLIETIEELGTEKANGFCSNIYFEEINQEVIDAEAWEISEYDGFETIKINNEAVELYREKIKKEKVENSISKFLEFTLNVINDDGSTDEEKIRAMKEAMTVHNTDNPISILADIVSNINYVPKFGPEYNKAEENFDSLSI